MPAVEHTTEGARNFITFCGEDPVTNKKYSVTIDPLTGAILTTSGGGIPPGLPASLFSDTVTLSGSAQQLPSQALVDGITLRNDDDNGNDIWVGHDATVAIDNGMRLPVGESLPITIDDLDKIWVIGTSTQLLHFIGG